jgi:hypothetical protein
MIFNIFFFVKRAKVQKTIVKREYILTFADRFKADTLLKRFEKDGTRVPAPQRCNN